MPMSFRRTGRHSGMSTGTHVRRNVPGQGMSLVQNRIHGPALNTRDRGRVDR
jgi:hypothetical protein